MEEKKPRDTMLRTTHLTPIFAFILWGATSGPWGTVSPILLDLRAGLAGFALTGILVVWVRQVSYWIKSAS